LLDIPLIKNENERVIKNVDLLIELNKKLRSVNLDREKEIIRKQINALEKQNDEIIYELYGLTKEEIEVIEGSLR
jgi:chaperonin cofactor prefoldin